MDRPVGFLRGQVRNGNSDRRDFEVPLTQEFLKMSHDQLNVLLGDEKAKVNFSQSFADKDYGNGFEVYVGVSLTCDQTEDGVASALIVAAELVRETLADMTEQAKELDRDLRTS